jgi:murein DD-endopeptidase MepM/ murein hydrolase activator NlpD
LVAPIERTIRRGGSALALAMLALLALASPVPAASGGGISSAPTAEAPLATTPGADSRQVYPIRGPHELWEGFGGARHHEGADVGSPCGTPLVAVGNGRVSKNEYHSRAGNYLVLDLKGTIYDVAYMHLIKPPALTVGQTVAAGQVVGYVGQTGNASGCHLHFELWEGAYYGGGAAIDPVPFLESLERSNKRLRQRGH